jgi:hypothetical protein
MGKEATMGPGGKMRALPVSNSLRHAPQNDVSFLRGLLSRHICSDKSLGQKDNGGVP